MRRGVMIFHEIGDWPEGRVHTTQTASTRAMLLEVEQAIDEAWAAASGRLGARLFDGPMCRLERRQACADALRLWISPTSYKPFLGTNLTNPHVPPACRADPLGLSAALVTRDNWLLLGRRNANVAYYPQRVHPFAGSLEPAESGNVFDGVRRELAEELGLRDDDLSDLRCIGLIEDARLRQPELIFSVRSSRTRAEIELMLNGSEHQACVAVQATPARVEAATRDALMTPVAVGTVLLWGRAAFGEGWFGSVSRSIHAA